MPGIFGILRDSPSAHHDSLLLMRKELEKHSPERRRFWILRGEHLELLVSSNGVLDEAKGLAESDERVVALEGSVWNWRDLEPKARTAPEAVLMACEAGASEPWHLLRGHFALAVYGKSHRLLHLATDCMATKPVYFASADGALVFGSELKALLPVLGQSPLDAAALTAYAHWGYVAGDRTLVSNVKALGPGQVLTGQASGKIKVVPYFEIDNAPRDIDAVQAEQALHAAFKKAAGTACAFSASNDDALYSTLTGGYDTRAVVKISSDLGYRPWKCAAFGDPRQIEMTYAKRAAKELGAEFWLADSERMDIVRRDLDVTVATTEAMSNFYDAVSVHNLMRQPAFEGCSVFHTGAFVGVILGVWAGHWPKRIPPPSPDNPDELDRFATCIGYSGHPRAVRQLMELTGDPAGSRNELHNALRDFLNTKEFLTWGHAQDLYHVLNQQIRGASGLLRGIEPRADYASMFVDPEIMDLALHLPLEMKVNQRFYRRLLRTRIFPPRLSRVPSMHNYGPLRRSADLIYAERYLKKKLYVSLLARMRPSYFHLRYGDYCRYSILENRPLRDFVCEELRSFDRCCVLKIDAPRFKRFLASWQEDPVPLLHMTRPLLILLHMKRWFDFWGRYVTHPAT